MVSLAEQRRTEFASLFYRKLSMGLIYRVMVRKGLKTPLSTIKDWSQRLRANPHAFLTGQRRRPALGNPRANRHGKPPLTAKEKMRIRETVKANPEQSYRTTAAHLPKGIAASYSTVRREAVKHGLHSFKKQKKPKLNREQRMKRREFAKGNMDREWALVVLSDEFTCTTAGSYNSKNNTYKAFRTKDVPSEPTQKYASTESRIAIITSKGALPLLPCPTNPTAVQLQQVLETAIPLIEAKLGHEYVLLHDLSSAFTANSTQDYLQTHVPSFFSKHEYPPNSPDINAVENLLADLKAYVHRVRPRNQTELCRALEDGWSEVAAQEKIDALYASMPARMAAVVSSQGGRTRF